MEARCLQFLTDAQRPRDHKTVKDIEKLKKFLYKNQEHRFTDREQTHLFQAIQVYANAPYDNKDGDNPALGLVDDALKMPFTVFTTSQKKSMLKWHAKLTGGAGGNDVAAGPASTKYQVIDISASEATCMDRDGETTDVALDSMDEGTREAVVKAFEEGMDVHVVIESGSNRVISHSVSQ